EQPRILVLADPLILHLFFFSSRRRHTRWPRDWSSDVCSSDLISVAMMLVSPFYFGFYRGPLAVQKGHSISIPTCSLGSPPQSNRSEERRVGKECRCRGAAGR